MPRVLILGERGTIGRQLAVELENRGHVVFRSDLQHSHMPRYIRADVGKYRDVLRVVDHTQPDYVFHLAAEFGRVNGEENYEALWQTNAIGTRNVLEAQARYGFRLVFASSSEVYGEVDVPDSGLLYEDLVMSSTPIQANDYAISKWVNELQIRHMTLRHKTETMTLRFFNSYGPGEYYHPYRSVVCLMCYRALHGMSFDVYQNYTRAFMFMDDFIPTLANTVDRFSAGETVNIGGLENRTVDELAEIILREVPEFDSSLVTYVPKEDLNIRDKRPDNSRAIALLDHGSRPHVPLEDGVKRTIDWMRETYGR